MNVFFCFVLFFVFCFFWGGACISEVCFLFCFFCLFVFFSDILVLWVSLLFLLFGGGFFLVEHPFSSVLLFTLLV